MLNKQHSGSSMSVSVKKRQDGNQVSKMVVNFWSPPATIWTTYFVLKMDLFWLEVSGFGDYCICMRIHSYFTSCLNLICAFPHLLVLSWSAALSWLCNNASLPWPLRISAWVPSGDFILTFPCVDTRNSLTKLRQTQHADVSKQS